MMRQTLSYNEEEFRPSRRKPSIVLPGMKPKKDID
jgi:hypothetical protein